MALPDPMLRAAVRGAMEAAASYDAEARVPYRQWALVHATYRVYEHLRRVHKDDRPVLARIRAAMAEFLALHKQVLDPFHDTRASNSRRLHAFSDGLLASGALGMAFGAQAIVSGEDDVVEVEGARRAGDALREVIAELPADAQALLAECFGRGHAVKDAAKGRAKGYRAVLRRYHKVLARVGAGLARRGVTEMPSWWYGAGEVAELHAEDDGEDEDDEPP
jgi:hypothetical protein